MDTIIPIDLQRKSQLLKLLGDRRSGSFEDDAITQIT